MEDARAKACRGDKENQNSSYKSLEQASLDSMGSVNQNQSLVLNVRKSRSGKRCLKSPTIRGFCSRDNSIPKHLLSLDEKYLRNCLEAIHLRALKAASCNISLNLSASMRGILSNGLNLGNVLNENASDFTKFAFARSLVIGAADGDESLAGGWILGSIMGSESMLNIMNSPLMHRISALECGAHFRRSNVDVVKDRLCHDTSLSNQLSICSSQKLEKEMPNSGSFDCEPEAKHMRFFSMSSVNSMSSELSSSSSYSSCCSSPAASVSQGMLHCTWNGGIPHFVFSLGDQTELYIADLAKVSSALETPGYMYSFYSKIQGQKENAVCRGENPVVGILKVSRRVICCQNDSKINETEFVLYGCENYAGGGETEPSSKNLTKYKSLSKKVMEVFKNGQMHRQVSIPTFGGASFILENQCSNKCKDISNKVDSGNDIRVCYLPKNLELAAIVTKEHVKEDKMEHAGGWGLKFLNKFGHSQNLDSPRPSPPSQRRTQNRGHSSTSMDVIISAGIHGGPRIPNAGPSSLIERWRSNGRCDCGGWDLGCPLTILNSASNKEEILLQEEVQGKCKEFDLYKQGSEHCLPTLRVTNVSDSLYVVHFQSTLSALQSFAIAVAYIHTQVRSLLPKNVQELK
ncbi:uncharacterized protein LOC115743385 [Rhodamnia argentea]|uniref:Uncharacterized protein LOC115743385 n=1 Tax=Rhodamnia argentea TaxID=178133 RepID=A0A8B8PIL9_9MYRT|nr:uncharacterized protein LOC115743385 [Rhodamnia argentea]